jgi:hypothetical protein
MTSFREIHQFHVDRGSAPSISRFDLHDMITSKSSTLTKMSSLMRGREK